MKNELEMKTVEIRTHLLGCVNTLKELNLKHKFSTDINDIDRAEKLLTQQEFDVVICGEIKQGKSSFINALLGRDVLPTDVKVATSQVFRISNTATESYHLEFWDGGKAEISLEELKKYGTEPDEVLINDPLLRGRRLKWISVNIPATFLPNNVHLLDTPGLGAIYQAHTEITNKYVSSADAVIFLKDSREPLTQTEKNFINTVTNVTKNILFVQTKSDTLDTETRVEILQRNEKLLNEHFSSKLGKKMTFYSFSAKNLLSASKQGDKVRQDMLRKVSGIDEISAALQMLFFRTVHYANTCAACNAAFDIYQRCATTINEQLKILECDDKHKKQEFVIQKRNVEVEFQKAWDIQKGEKWRILSGGIKNIIDTGSTMAQRMCCTGAPIETYFLAEINKLDDKDIKTLQAIAQRLPADIQSAVQVEWQNIYNQTIEQLSHKFIGFQNDLRPRFSDNGQLYLEPNNLMPAIGDTGKFSKLRNIWSGVTLGGIAGAALASVFTGGASLLVAITGIIAGGIWAKKDADALQGKAAKRELLNYLHQALAQINHSLSAPSGVGTKGQIQTCFEQLYNDSLKACENIRDKEGQKLRDELTLLEEQAEMGFEETKKQLNKLQNTCSEMKNLQECLTRVRNQLVEIKKQTEME